MGAFPAVGTGWLRGVILAQGCVGVCSGYRLRLS